MATVYVPHSVMVAGRELELVAVMLDDLARSGYLDGLEAEDRARVDALALNVQRAAVAHRAASGDRVAASGDRVELDGLRGGQCVTYDAAARTLSLSKRQIRRLVADGKLPAVSVGGARRIRSSDLAALLHEREEAS